MAGCSAVKKIRKLEKLENVLIVKLITWQHAKLCGITLSNYHI
jgi:hypothetical protein